MANLTSTAIISPFDLYGTGDSTTQTGLTLGQLAFTQEGKMFRYSLVGAADLVRGNLLQARAEDTQFENMAVTASAIATVGTPQVVNVTNGSTTIAANDFVGGSISVYTTPDLGSEYTILGHSIDSVGSSAITVTIDRVLQTAWTTSTKINMKWNPWFKVIQFPATTQTSIPVGVAVSNLKTATYGWIQTHGMCSVLSDGSTFAVGSTVGTPSGTAGCVTVAAAGTTHTNVGIALQAAASGHNISVFLQID